MRKTLLTAAFFLGLIGAQSAIAATCTATEASKVTPLDGGASPNCQTFSGNDSEGVLNGLTLFGFDDWSLLARDNAGTGGWGTPDSGDSTAFSLTNTVFDGDGEPVSGDWTINDISFGDYVFVVKASNEFFAYLIDGFAGTFASAAVNNKGKTQAISHISVYARGSSGSSPVPVPAALPLMLSGVGVLGMLRLRRRTAK